MFYVKITGHIFIVVGKPDTELLHTIHANELTGCFECLTWIFYFTPRCSFENGHNDQRKNEPEQ